MFSDSFELSKSLARIYQKHVQDETWTDMPCSMKQSELALKFYSEWIDLHEVFRYYTFKVYSTSFSLK